MPLLGFTVFKDKILDGSKTQTIRKWRKHPIQVGDKLYLYWHTRQKDCEKLGEGVCIEAFPIQIHRDYWLGRHTLRFLKKPKDDNMVWEDFTIEEEVDLITKDGFKDNAEMYAFFDRCPLPDVFQVIRWVTQKNTENQK